MLVIRQHRIYRKDIQANPNILYIFGDNLDREGMGGQAAEMRGEPNSFGIATKRSITHNYPKDYFFDNQDDVEGILKVEMQRLIDHAKTNTYDAIVIPMDGIGTGLSRMPVYAPENLRTLNYFLNNLGDYL